MNPDHCLVERDGQFLVVTLDRPEAKNALSGGTLAGMYRAWRQLDEDPELRVAILTGRGEVFCAGADLKAMGGGEKDEEFQKLMAEAPKPSAGSSPFGGSSVRLRRQIPYTLAAEILLMARHVTAQEAPDFGLVGRVVPSCQTLAEA